MPSSVESLPISCSAAPSPPLPRLVARCSIQNGEPAACSQTRSACSPEIDGTSCEARRYPIRARQRPQLEPNARDLEPIDRACELPHAPRRPPGGDHHQWPTLARSGSQEVVADRGARLVDPLKVVDEEQQRPGRERPIGRLEDIEARLAGVEATGVKAERDERVAGGGEGDAALRLVPADVEHAERRDSLAKLGHQARLAGSGISRQERRSGRAAGAAAAQLLQPGELGVATQERPPHGRQPTLGRHLSPLGDLR